MSIQTFTAYTFIIWLVSVIAFLGVTEAVTVTIRAARRKKQQAKRNAERLAVIYRHRLFLENERQIKSAAAAENE